MTVQVAMNAPSPMGIGPGMPIPPRVGIIAAPVSTPRRMSGVASRALSSHAPPATPRRIATKARLADSAAPLR